MKPICTLQVVYRLIVKHTLDKLTYYKGKSYWTTILRITTISTGLRYFMNDRYLQLEGKVRVSHLSLRSGWSDAVENGGRAGEDCGNLAIKFDRDQE